MPRATSAATATGHHSLTALLTHHPVLPSLRRCPSTPASRRTCTATTEGRPTAPVPLAAVFFHNSGPPRCPRPTHLWAPVAACDPKTLTAEADGRACGPHVIYTPGFSGSFGFPTTPVVAPEMRARAAPKRVPAFVDACAAPGLPLTGCAPRRPLPAGPLPVP